MADLDDAEDFLSEWKVGGLGMFGTYFPGLNADLGDEEDTVEEATLDAWSNWPLEQDYWNPYLAEDFDVQDDMLEWKNVYLESGAKYEGTLEVGRLPYVESEPLDEEEPDVELPDMPPSVWRDIAIFEQAHGRGVLTYPEGDRYEGSFYADELSGHGVYHWYKGVRLPDTLLLEWFGADEDEPLYWWRTDGKFFGRGPFPDMYQRTVDNKPIATYMGQWKEDTMHGCGVLIYHDDGTTLAGEWEEDEFMGDFPNCGPEETDHHMRMAQLNAHKARMFQYKPGGMTQIHEKPDLWMHPYFYDSGTEWQAPGPINQFYEVPEIYKPRVARMDAERESWLNSWKRAGVDMPTLAEQHARQEALEKEHFAVLDQTTTGVWELAKKFREAQRRNDRAAAKRISVIARDLRVPDEEPDEDEAVVETDIEPLKGNQIVPAETKEEEEEEEEEEEDEDEEDEDEEETVEDKSAEDPLILVGLRDDRILAVTDKGQVYRYDDARDDFVRYVDLTAMHDTGDEAAVDEQGYALALQGIKEEDEETRKKLRYAVKGDWDQTVWEDDLVEEDEDDDDKDEKDKADEQTQEILDGVITSDAVTDEDLQNLTVKENIFGEELVLLPGDQLYPKEHPALLDGRALGSLKQKLEAQKAQEAAPTRRPKDKDRDKGGPPLASISMSMAPVMAALQMTSQLAVRQVGCSLQRLFASKAHRARPLPKPATAARKLSHARAPRRAFDKDVKSPAMACLSLAMPMGPFFRPAHKPIFRQAGAVAGLFAQAELPRGQGHVSRKR